MIRPKLLIQTPEEFRQALEDFAKRSHDFMIFWYAMKHNVPKDEQSLMNFAMDAYIKCMTNGPLYTVDDPINILFKVDDKSKFSAALCKLKKGRPVEFWGKTSKFEHATLYKVNGKTPEEIYISLKESYDKFWDLLEKFEKLEGEN